MRGDVVAEAHARFADRAPRRPHPVQRLPAIRDVRCPASGVGFGLHDDIDAERVHATHVADAQVRSEEHTSELQSLMRTSYAVFCLKKKKKRSSTLTNEQI